MKVYRILPCKEVRSDGVFLFDDEGERRNVDGQVYVMTPGGWMQPDDGKWCESRSDARRAAADRVSEMARTLLAQAERLREEADSGTG